MHSSDSDPERLARQITHCKGYGWEYLGDGLFAKDDFIGWFEGSHFCKEYVEPGQQSLNSGQ